MDRGRSLKQHTLILKSFQGTSHRNHVSISGHGLKKTTADNYFKCQEKCQEETKCKGYTYDKKNKVCWLEKYTYTSANFVYGLKGIISGPKYTVCKL